MALCFAIRHYYDQVVQKLERLKALLDVVAPTGAATAGEPDSNKPVAAILVGGYSGLGVHTFLNAIRFGPGKFEGTIFLSVGVVDSGNFKGSDAVEDLRKHTAESLDQYVDHARRLGMPAVGYMSIGTDPVDELEHLCVAVKKRFPRCTFFAGQLVFQRDTWYQRWLHNETAYSLQRRLQWDGVPMVILPTVREVAGDPMTDKVLRAGAATSNITPPLGVSLNGGMQDRAATHIHDELHARALVLDNGQEKLAIVVCDSCMLPRAVLDKAKHLVHGHTRIPLDRVLVSATHAHSAPTAGPTFQSEPDAAYLEFLSVRISDAIRRAVNNLAPAKIGWGVGREATQVFNRRWKMKSGTPMVDPFGRADQVAHEPTARQPRPRRAGRPDRSGDRRAGRAGNRRAAAGDFGELFAALRRRHGRRRRFGRLFRRVRRGASVSCSKPIGSIRRLSASCRTARAATSTTSIFCTRR